MGLRNNKKKFIKQNKDLIYKYSQNFFPKPGNKNDNSLPLIHIQTMF